MKAFEKIIESAYNIILEQPEPPVPSNELSNPDPTAAGGTPSALPSAPGGVGEQPAGGPTDMEDGSKRDADPISYTENLLKKLIDPNEGLTPEMFDEFLNTFNIASTKIKDKAGFAKFYNDFYKKLQDILQTKQDLSRMFKTFHSAVKDLVINKTEEPDTAGGGVGRPGPSGPGVM